MKRFDKAKRCALMVCFLMESQKILLDHLVNMHDQYIMDLCRECKHAYEQKHRKLRKQHKKAVDVMLQATHVLLDLPEKQPTTRETIFSGLDETLLRQSIETMRLFKRLEERGYTDALLARYPSLRKYFSAFIQLPFQAEEGSQSIIDAIHIIRKLGV